ncbi:MAG: APC family permease [Solirubrobacteraceae bacterium]
MSTRARPLLALGRIAPAGRLRRELGQLATASVSIGVMAPTLAMSITGVAAAGLLGRAAPLAYVLAAFGVGLVAYGFARLSGEFAGAGSVYAFVGGALGRRAGFVCGWALLGTYLVFPVVSISAAAVFGRALLHSTGIAANAAWLPLAIGAWAIVWLVAAREIRTAARTLLLFEIGSVALIGVLMAIVVARLATGDAPHGQTVNLDVVRLPAGTSLSTIALASTFGFLSFAGFESAGSLGEEATAPRRMVPRSMAAAILFGAVFYVLCVSVQTLGFGTDAAGVRAFAASPAPLGALAQTYVGSAMADALDAAALISALGAGLGCASVAARMLFALGRERWLPGGLAGVSSTGAPARGLAFVMLLDLAILVVFGAAGTAPMKVFFYFATIGTLSLLVMYLLTNLATIAFLGRRGARAELTLPVAGVAVAAYVLYHNVWPVPASPFDVFPYLVGAWLCIGAGLALARGPGR